MCGGIRLRVQGRGAPLVHAEMMQIRQYCAEGVLQPARPAGLAIVAALEAELLQSPGAAAVVGAKKDAESALDATSSRPRGRKSVAIAIPASSDQKGTRDIISSSYRSRYFKTGTSIFSTALSPPGGCCSCSCCIHTSACSRPSPDFLGACFFCKRVLGPANDIYMYRGDRAFCSIECRYMHIVEDESLSSAIPIEKKRAQPYSSTNTATITPLTIVTVLS